jgi:uncharacterized repeat protein (TIGR03833 family)
MIMKLYILLCLIIMFFTIAGCPSDEPASMIDTSDFSFQAVNSAEGSSTGDNPAVIPEASTLIMLGSGLIGLAGFGRKMFKKYTSRGLISPGFHVRIVLKKDQRSGKLTEGIVKDILTKSPTHPHGIKVRLESGEVGRVREILG